MTAQINADRLKYGQTNTQTDSEHTHLDIEVMGFMNRDVQKNGGMFNLLPSGSMQVDMTITCQ